MNFASNKHLGSRKTPIDFGRKMWNNVPAAAIFMSFLSENVHFRPLSQLFMHRSAWISHQTSILGQGRHLLIMGAKSEMTCPWLPYLCQCWAKTSVSDHYLKCLCMDLDEFRIGQASWVKKYIYWFWAPRGSGGYPQNAGVLVVLVKDLFCEEHCKLYIFDWTMFC